MNHEQLYQQNAERMDKILRQITEEQQRIKEQRKRVRRYRRLRKLRKLRPTITCLIFIYLLWSFICFDWLWFTGDIVYRASAIVSYILLCMPIIFIDDKR